jgi:hypothetical protein
LFPLFEAVGIVPGFEDVAVVRNPIQQCRGHLGVSKDLHPFAKAEIGGDDQGRFFVELAAEVEEQSATGGGEREIAEFVKDYGVDLDEVPGEGPGFAKLFFPFQLIDQIDHIEEAYSLAGRNGRRAEGNGQVAFPGARAADKD